MFKTGDAQALADTIAQAVSAPETVVKLGKNCLTVAKSMTHQQMHTNRAAFYRDTVGFK